MATNSSGGDRYSANRSEKLTRAALYVRMSTEHQQYSTENQSDVIIKFAAERGYEIVRRYADEGKSGLSIDGREALKTLIRDVQSGTADFSVVLVYDVSRWGRFQDADESAYYEFICKKAGIRVLYCAEQFENDGSSFAAIVKGVKRAMAGEYSRELSVKVFNGQSRLIELGFRQGGSPGYGLRRMRIDHTGVRKGLLKRGEHKSIHTDRVILVPGPAEEVETVRWIYNAFVVDDWPERKIAAHLNVSGKTTDHGRPWSRGTVHQVLINEKYVGNNVWNRSSFKLKQRKVVNAPDLWVRAVGAFEPIVDSQVFQAARLRILARSHRYTDEQMIDRLRELYVARGNLSGLIIDEADSTPSSSAYQSRFGSLLRAYKLVGFTPYRDYEYVEINRVLRQMHPEVVHSTIREIEHVGGEVTRDPETDLLNVNGEFTASIAISRFRETAAGTARWCIRFDTGLSPDITIAVRMDHSNRAILDYYLLPLMDMSVAAIRLGQDNGISLDAYRFGNLEHLYAMAMRSNILEVA